MTWSSDNPANTMRTFVTGLTVAQAVKTPLDFVYFPHSKDIIRIQDKNINIHLQDYGPPLNLF